MSTRFIVVFDDDQGVCVPMGWEDDCEGALCAYGRHVHVALFNSRADARRAIRISSAYARLRKEQGKPANDDFLAALKCVKVLPCKEGPAS